MFKKFSKISLLVILITFLVACGNSNQAGGNNKISGKNSDSKGVKTIRISHVLPEDHPTNTTLVDYFKPIIEEKSGGKIKVEIYPNAQLGSDRQAIESVINGSIEMSVPGGPVISGFYEPYMVYDLPFLFNSREAAYSAFDGELKDKLSDGLLKAQNIRILGIGENGFRHITTNNKAIKAPEDLKGLKIRTMECPVHLKTFEALGANPTPIAFNELFTALQQGTVDGQENPIAIIYTSKLYEVQNYLTLDGHYYVNCPYIVNENFWQSLSKEEQDIVQKAIDETVKQQRIELEKQEQEYLELIKKSGTKVIELSDEQKDKFKKSTQSVYEWFEENYEDGKDLVDMAKSYNK
ncbi:hypothetical protein HMPREF2134_03415 [Peptoniphilus lacrimalis DNF00528]|nr:hypothetical protein HMPREF2134_03415 [Peptoniphilus lacrimalis DNF00528]